MGDSEHVYVLETPRLTLRKVVASDVEFIAEMLLDRAVTKHYGHVYTRADADEWMERGFMRYERDGYAFWLAEHKETGQPIGQMGLLNQEVNDETLLEIGYMVHPSHWRQGYAHETTCAIRDYAFESLDREKVVSLIAPANIPSQRVALKYGAKPERFVRWRDEDCLVFGLTRQSDLKIR